MYSDLTKQDPLSRMKTLCVNYFLLFKTKDVIATEEKDILHDVDSSDSKAVPLSELKRFVKSRSDKLKNSLNNSNFENRGIAKSC